MKWTPKLAEENRDKDTVPPVVFFCSAVVSGSKLGRLYQPHKSA